MEQRNVVWTFLKDIRSFHDFQNIYTKKYMDINVYFFSHMLVECELLGKRGLISNRALTWNV